MSRYTRMQLDSNGRTSTEVVKISAIIIDVALAIIVFTGLMMAGMPRYNVWQQEMEGRAALAKAEQDRQITVREAQAKRDSAVMYAEADVERAKGAAKANQIIGESLKGNEQYIRYLWVTEVATKDTAKTVVYVPTEANMPILEAPRLAQ